ncbi:hypothetical protein [Paraburkholderia sp. EG286B]|uniref:hypothetical protein n=1 Tax=Paraburkholderia sp. EG286B TaxID=3237011 RepID=UPI0034D1ABD0
MQNLVVVDRRLQFGERGDVARFGVHDGSFLHELMHGAHGRKPANGNAFCHDIAGLRFVRCIEQHGRSGDRFADS